MDLRKLLNWGMLIAILVLSAALWSKCENGKQSASTIKALQAENKKYKLSNGKIATSAKVITLPKNQAPKTPDTKPFSKVTGITYTMQELRIDTIYVPYKDSVPCVFKREGQFVVKEYSFKYRADQFGIGIRNMVIRDSATYVMGSKRNWLLGQSITTLDVSHSNKYVIDTGLRHIEYKDPVKWYETGLFKFGAGLLIGVAVTK